MKKSIRLSILFILLNATTAFCDFGLNCPDTTIGSKANYMCRRFVNVNYNRAKYLIDLNDVSAVMFDANGHVAAQAQYPPTFPAEYYYIRFKSGHYFFAGNASVVYDFCKNYIELLNLNPEFLNLP